MGRKAVKRLYDMYVHLIKISWLLIMINICRCFLYVSIKRHQLLLHNNHYSNNHNDDDDDNNNNNNKTIFVIMIQGINTILT